MVNAPTSQDGMIQMVRSLTASGTRKETIVRYMDMTSPTSDRRQVGLAVSAEEEVPEEEVPGEAVEALARIRLTGTTRRDHSTIVSGTKSEPIVSCTETTSRTMDKRPMKLAVPAAKELLASMILTLR